MILGVSLFSLLGHWQMQRGFAKQTLEAQRIAAAASAPEAWAGQAAAEQARQIRVQGRYLPERSLLLDNQSHAHTPGYHVWTPLQTEDGTLLLVDRGWVPAAADRRQTPAVSVSALAQTVSGLWRTLPQAGMTLGRTNCPPGQWPPIVQYPDRSTVSCLLGRPVADGLLLLDPDMADGFVRDWSITQAMPPARHFAYAAQWFALAVVALVLFVALNVKKH